MTITLRLDAETESRLKEEAARNGLTVEEFIQRLAEQAVFGGRPAPVIPQRDWEAELRAWAASHPALPWPADDSRESIYAGRGE
jgi:hypothetical protein